MSTRGMAHNCPPQIVCVGRFESSAWLDTSWFSSILQIKKRLSPHNRRRTDQRSCLDDGVSGRDLRGGYTKADPRLIKNISNYCVEKKLGVNYNTFCNKIIKKKEEEKFDFCLNKKKSDITFWIIVVLLFEINSGIALRYVIQTYLPCTATITHIFFFFFNLIETRSAHVSLVVRP